MAVQREIRAARAVSGDGHPQHAPARRRARNQRVRKLSQLLGAMLVGATTRSLAVLTGASRPAIDRLMAEAGVLDVNSWRRLHWLFQTARKLFGGWLRRAAGRVFDQCVREYRCGRLVF